MTSKEKLEFFKWIDEEFLQPGTFADFQMTVIDGNIANMKHTVNLKITNIVTVQNNA